MKKYLCSITVCSSILSSTLIEPTGYCLESGCLLLVRNNRGCLNACWMIAFFEKVRFLSRGWYHGFFLSLTWNWILSNRGTENQIEISMMLSSTGPYESYYWTSIQVRRLKGGKDCPRIYHCVQYLPHTGYGTRTTPIRYRQNRPDMNDSSHFWISDNISKLLILTVEVSGRRKGKCFLVGVLSFDRVSEDRPT